jgi:hypothetical protein
VLAPLPIGLEVSFLAMDSQRIPVPTQNRLIAKLAPMRGDVIET